ncbi:hypothetical protein QW71_19185 [Paenibacillus sp. IHB B 3415]|nr:hypothetical protein QW71_19185 [Paenibacillus sp. IHB B 3415]
MGEAGVIHVIHHHQILMYFIQLIAEVRLHNTLSIGICCTEYNRFNFLSISRADLLYKMQLNSGWAPPVQSVWEENNGSLVIFKAAGSISLSISPVHKRG